MSGPALNPLANIATAVKGADAARSDSSPLSASGSDAADSGFARELQRQIDRDTTPAADTPASASSPTPPGKTDAGQATTKGSSAETVATKAKAPEDGQPPPPDMAALLGSLLIQSTGATASGPSGSSPAVAISDAALQPDDSQLLPAQAAPAPGDPALAALIAAGMPPPNTPVVTLTPSSREAVSDGKTRAGLTANQQAGSAGLSLADDAADQRRVPLEVTLASQTQDTAPLDATAKLAAVSETAGKERNLAAETTPANNFANLHAAALANLRGEPTTHAPAPVPLHVATPPGSPGWPEEVGSRVSWMVGHDESHAQLTLTPPQLGKIEVSITVSGDQTSAQFVAATPAARELIEQSLPRLREILEQSGINLGQTDVGTSGQSNNSAEGQRGNARGDSRGSDEGAAPRPVSPQWGRRGDGLVDTFA